MNQSPNIEALLANSYQEGMNAVKSKNWLQAMKWLEPVYKEAPDYEKVSAYYFYAAGMFAYESRHWKEALKNLQAVQEKDPSFEGCAKLVEAVRQRQSAAEICAQALRLVGEQTHILPEDQKWDEIVSELTKATRLDSEHEEIPAKLEEVKKYQTAQKQFIASLKDLQEKKYKEALKKLEGINDSYKEFCPTWASRREEAAKGEPLQELYEQGQAARFRNDWTRAVRYFQELCDNDKGSIYPEAKRLLEDAKELESKSNPQLASKQESKKPFWKQEVFWVAIGSLAAVALIIVALLPYIYTLGTPMPTLTAVATEDAIAVANATGTAITVEHATAAANATETAMAAESATAVANATGTAVAVESATAVAHATETAMAAESATAAANATQTAVAVESATALANATGTAVAVESATVAAHATETAIVVESATAAANATGTATAAENATATALAILPLASAPTLLEPLDGATLALPTRLDLAWTWDGTLEADDYYQVEIWNKYFGFSSPIDVAWVKGSPYKHDVIKEAYDPEFRWRITVVRGKSEGEKGWSTPENPVWEPGECKSLSVESATWALFVEPGTETPPDPNPPKPNPSCLFPPCD